MSNTESFIFYQHLLLEEYEWGWRCHWYYGVEINQKFLSYFLPYTNLLLYKFPLAKKFIPNPLLYSFKLRIFNEHISWKAPGPYTKSIRNSHLVVFILLAPCGPWRCRKHGKPSKDQSKLISILTKLEWWRCIVCLVCPLESYRW